MARLQTIQKLTPEQLMAQIKELPIKLDVSTLNFTVDVRQKAMDTFHQSFKYHRFYSARSERWQDWTENTRKKRIANHTWKNGLLREYKTMYESLNVERGDRYDQRTVEHIIRQRVFTNPAKYYTSTNPHRGFCYAGIHNNPGPGDTYGNGFGGKRRVVKAVQRQFMGFSTYIDKHVESNIDKFLLDGVFGKMVKTTGIQQPINDD